MGYTPINRYINKNCKSCAVNDKCICHECINFYTRGITYDGGSCIDSVIRSGCHNFNIGREEYGCIRYAEIDWIYKIKYSKKIEVGRKKLRSLMGGLLNDLC